MISSINRLRVFPAIAPRRVRIASAEQSFNMKILQIIEHFSSLACKVGLDNPNSCAAFDRLPLVITKASLIMIVVSFSEQTSNKLVDV